MVGFVCLDGVFLSFSISPSGNPTLGLYSRMKSGPFIPCIGQLTSNSSATMTLDQSHVCICDLLSVVAYVPGTAVGQTHSPM